MNWSNLSLVGRMNGQGKIHWPRLFYRLLRHALGAILLFLLLYSLWFLLAGPGFMGILDTWADPSFDRLLLIRLFGFVAAVLVLTVVAPMIGPFFLPLDSLPQFSTLPAPSRFERLLPFVVASLITLLALFYTIESWRGRRTWEKYEDQMEAQGEKMEFADFIPPAVPDAENFATIPLLAGLFDYNPKTSEWGNPAVLQRWQSFGARYYAAREIVILPEPSDANSWVWTINGTLKAWHAAFRQITNAATPNRKQRREALERAETVSANLEEAARGVLVGLSESEEVIEELRAASGRPYSRFNIPYKGEQFPFIPLLHVGRLYLAGEVLRLRASAKLVLGRVEEAFADLHLIFGLIDAIQGEPFEWSYTIRTRNLRQVFSLLAEGIAKGRWSDTQLQQIQERLSRLDRCAEAKYVLEAERVLSGVRVIDQVRRSSERYELIERLDFLPDNPLGRNVRALLTLAPSGWFYLEQVNFSRSFQENLLATIDVPGRQIAPNFVNELGTPPEGTSGHLELGWLFRHELFWQSFIQFRHQWNRLLAQAAFAQSGVDAAVLACALEHYRRIHGQFPDKLETLVPDFVPKLPHDIVTRQPLQYHRADNGRFKLYSAGWNGTDEGGMVARYFEQGDWVWGYEEAKGD